MKSRRLVLSVAGVVGLVGWLAVGGSSAAAAQASATPSAVAAPAAAAASVAAETSGVDLVWGFKIPLRDGVKLNGTVYRPAGQTQGLPVIFTLTPYVGDSYHERGMYFARHGYVFVLVDVRGRGDSAGTFDPFAQEAHDGYDVVEFLARQSWSNGKIGMWGGSYAGYDQWATLKEAPPHLATIVPAAAAHPGVDFPFDHGVFYSYDMQWITFTSGAAHNGSLFGDGSYWGAKFLDLYRRQAAFETLDTVVGNPSAIFHRWLAHPAVDAHWLAMSPTPEQFARMNVPILTITGDYDGDQGGALAYYRDFMRYATPEARQRHYLIIGPWDHAGTRTPGKQVGGLEFGDASALDLNKLHKEWYDWTLKGGPRPEFLQQRVAYYEIGAGAETWKYAADLAAVEAERRTLYLGSNGAADSAFHSGTLAAAPPARHAAADHYVYDPRDLRRAELEEHPNDAYLTDETPALNLLGGGTIYHSEPFDKPTEISGQVKLALWLSLDVPDTDLTAILYEIQPDGRSVQLTSAILRARYRHSPSVEQLVVPGAVERYDFDHFSWFSRRVAKGSRLRLVIESPNSSFLEKNYNSGKAVASETGADARVAHVTVYHDAEHPSALELPIAH